MISFQIKGKEVFSSKDIIFFVISGFILGFSVALGIYTSNLALTILFITATLVMLLIYTFRFVKTFQENVANIDEYIKLKKSNESMMTFPNRVHKPRKKFFEA